MTKPWPHQNWSWPIRVGVATGVLALVVFLGRVVVTTPSAEAHADATFTVLYSFEGSTDGGSPYAGLVRDAAGNLYGTTAGGGAFGRGTVFKLDTTGTKTVLHTFTGAPLDGQIPDADLILDAAGNLYGTTGSGGAHDYGTVFKLDTTGTESVLHSFPESPLDGNGPFGGLVRDATGNLYGTTAGGGASNQGTVFKLDTAGKLTVLYSFTGPPLDGQYPIAGLVRDAVGNLYGTTSLGGDPECNYPWGCGTVFKLDTTGTETLLHNFTASRLDGALPAGRLVRDAAGNLYGATQRGGASRLGIVFKLDPTGAETVLHSFTGGTTDGATPLAGLLQGAAGNLFGTTSYGGVSNFGTVFRVTTSGTETLLHSLRRNTDGIRPQADLIRDPAGNLYGTTPYGGRFNQGTVFKLSP